MGVTSAELADRFPRLYHMAEAGSWPGIRRHGLLSTSALLDLYGLEGAARTAIEAAHRPASVPIRHPEHGLAVIRDQKPMDDEGLRQSLQGGLTPSDWYRLLNDKVFFWLTEERLMRLLNARAYRRKRQAVLTLDTARLLERHAERVLLSPINSGATKPYPQPRGPETFLPLADYPFAEWDKRRRRKDPAVELAVRYAVPDVRDLVLRVDEREGGETVAVLWEG